MGMSLEEILEREFNLSYYLNLSRDCDEIDTIELKWLYGRLIKQKREEKEAAQNLGDKFRWRK